MTQTGWKDIPHHRTLCLIYKLREVGQERPFSSQGQAEHQSAGGEQWYWASLFSFCYLPFHHNCYCFYFYGYCYFFFFSTVQLFLAQLTGFIFFLILIPIPMGEGRGERRRDRRGEEWANSCVLISWWLWLYQNTCKAKTEKYLATNKNLTFLIK